MSQRYIGGLMYNPPGGYSGYLNGSSYLTWTGTSIGTNAFTFECWFLYNGAAFPPAGQDGASFIGPSSASSSALNLNIVNSTTVSFDRYGVSADNFTLPTLSAGQWYHIAFVRNASNATTVFLNGIRSSTGTVTSSYNYSGTTNAVGFTGGAVSRYFPGYISNARLVVGSAVYDPTQTSITVPNGPLQAIANTTLLTCAYSTFRDGSTNNYTITVTGGASVSTQNPFPLTTLPNPAQGNAGNGIFSMSQYQSLKQQNLWPAIDPYFEYTTLLLHGNGTNGAQNNTFLDSSTNNFTITRNGNTTQGSFSPFSQTGWSNYFDGSGDYLEPSSATNATNFGTGDFTCEFWYFPTADGQQNCLDNFGNAQIAIYRNTSKYINYYIGGDRITSTSVIANNSWWHVALVRSSGTTRLYINGSQEGSSYADSTNFSGGTAYPRIGASYLNTVAVQGYISNLRIVKGTAVYTSNFTVPTTPLTAITNTSLLTCQSNRFIDNSSNAFAITVTGSPSVQRFSPFNPSAPYAAGTIGGSGYFDGSGDYLSLASTTALQFGTGDFTVEAWVYLTATPSAQYAQIIGRTEYGTNADWMLQITNGRTLTWYMQGSFIATSTGMIPLNAWTHVAATRSGSSVRLFINGTIDGTATNSGSTENTSSGDYTIGADQAGDEAVYTGYMSSLRAVKGTAVYTANFTPPTSPLTAIANTSLLLNFTNGGIIDNAMMNDLETVGNAQISTTQSKFGGSSMYFDGSSWLYDAAGLLDFGTGDFTIEFWVYRNSTANGGLLRSGGSTTSGSTGQYFLLFESSNTTLTWQSRVGVTNQWGVSSTPLTTSAWHHIAVVRQSGVFKVFFNGTSQSVASGSFTDSTSYSCAQASVGGNFSGYNFNGYIDDFRITKGYARYTANFTPQTSQWQDQ